MLNTHDFDFLSETDIFQAKRRIFRHFAHDWPALAETWRNNTLESGDTLPAAFTSRPRVAKGENYHELPYFLMDYPSVFHREDIFAMRWMCWWGKYFSASIILSGQSLAKYGNALVQQKEALHSFQFCLHKDPWENRRLPKYFQPFTKVDSEQIEKCQHEHQFIRLTHFYPLSEAWEIQEKFDEDFALLREIFKQ